MSQSRRERRHEERQKSKAEKLGDAFEEKFEQGLAQEYRLFLDAIIQGYQSRLNKYLVGLTPEMKEKIGYDFVEIELQIEWKPTDAEVMARVREVRKHQLAAHEEVLYLNILRKHYVVNEKDNKEENKLVEHTVIWANLTYRTEQLKTKNQVEIVSLTSAVGFLAEKGIEYQEAERQQKIALSSNYPVSLTD